MNISKEELEEIKSILEKVASIKGSLWDIEEALEKNPMNLSDEIIKDLTDAVDIIRKSAKVLDKLEKLIDEE